MSMIEFIPKTKESLKKFIIQNKSRKLIFNFLSAYGVYLYSKNKRFRSALDSMKSNTLNSIDSVAVSFLLGRAHRLRSTEFTRFLLSDPNFIEDNKFLFIGIEEKDLETLTKLFPNLNRKNLFVANGKEELLKVAKSKKIDYLFICLESPVQEVLSAEIYDLINVQGIFNVGKALDFILLKQKEAPKVLQTFGLEWAYHLFTDFPSARKRIRKTLISILFLSKTISKKSFEKDAERLIITSGYFDPIHKGHLEYLKLSKELGGKLVVILNNDKQCTLKKSRPFMTEDERAKILESLKFVDAVFISVDTDRTVCKSLKKIAEQNQNKEMIFAKGGDRFSYEIPEAKICKKFGIQIIDGLGDKIQSSSKLTGLNENK